MNEHLERLFSADEEGRARLQAARASARDALDLLRQRLEREREEKHAALVRALEEEASAIQQEAERAAALRRQRRAEFRAERRRQGERVLPQAVDAFVRILREGPPEKTP